LSSSTHPPHTLSFCKSYTNTSQNTSKNKSTTLDNTLPINNSSSTNLLAARAEAAHLEQYLRLESVLDSQNKRDVASVAVEDQANDGAVEVPTPHVVEVLTVKACVDSEMLPQSARIESVLSQADGERAPPDNGNLHERKHLRLPMDDATSSRTASTKTDMTKDSSSDTDMASVVSTKQKYMFKKGMRKATALMRHKALYKAGKGVNSRPKKIVSPKVAKKEARRRR
jgi:hypothetical protein